jgi:hypothetical protein
MPAVAIDHLVIAAQTLEEGAAYVHRTLGVTPEPGGKHELMATHNVLLRLGEKLYLEIIAVDPDGIRPDGPRWYDLDALAMRVALEEGPRLVTWAARTADIEGLAARSSEPLGPIRVMRRGDLEWQMTVPEDGHLPGDGLVPTLIQWQSARHPADGLADQGCRLQALGATHTSPDLIRRALTSLDAVALLSVTYGASPRLAARINTPYGVKTLSS